MCDCCDNSATCNVCSLADPDQCDCTPGVDCDCADTNANGVCDTCDIARIEEALVDILIDNVDPSEEIFPDPYPPVDPQVDVEDEEIDTELDKKA